MNAPVPEPPAIADETWASYWGQRAAELIAAIEQLPGVTASISLTLHYRTPRYELALGHGHPIALRLHELKAYLRNYTLSAEDSLP